MTVKADAGKPAPEAQLQSLFDKFDPKHQRFIRSIQSALQKRFPTANELAYDYSSFFVIAYSPTEQGIDGVVSFAARADGVDLYFTHGPQLPDPKKLLQGSGKQTRFIRLESAGQMSDPDVEEFFAGAIRLANVPMPSQGKGSLIIKTFKNVAAKKQPARKPSKAKPKKKSARRAKRKR